MSAYNRRTQSVQQTKKIQSLRNTKVSEIPPIPVPGTPIQQMWTVLKFHEQRLGQIGKYLQQVEEGQSNTEQQVQPTETEQMIQYNTLLQQVSELTERVAILEGQKKSDGEEVTLSIEEDFQNASLGQPEV
mgnify:CR=1 FL=1